MSEMVERICRAKAAKHYAKRFGKPETDPHVLANVEGNWNIFAGEVRETIAAMREPTRAMLKAENVHPSCHMCGGHLEGWQAMIDAALKDDQ
jgi:hypothetical protein